jgi:microcin C transport system substrate-binding protein
MGLTHHPSSGGVRAARLVSATLRRLGVAAFLSVAIVCAASDAPNGGDWVHAYAAYGSTPKYPRGFDHFAYVEPNAPKGGTLYLGNPDRRSSFDKSNPFTVRGNAPAGLSLYMFESLAVLSGDELQTMYGLLAEEMQVAPDLSSVSFRLHPQARFTNGDPVTAADVKHSFDTLTGKYVSPVYPSLFSALGRAVVVDVRTVRFEFRDRNIDSVFLAGGLPVFSAKWGLGADGKAKRFDEIVTEIPITSGPYTVALADSGRRLELKRDPNYWARDLGVRRGSFNFDRVVYRYYRDRAVMMEAFKAGEFEMIKEYSARRWMRQHQGPKWNDGRIVKVRYETKMGQGVQAYRLNLRRPLFADIRVRQALGYTYDFENVNRYRLYQRAYSLFNNTGFAADGLPGPDELKLLEPFRGQLPPAVFGAAYRPPRTDGSPNGLRENLLRARDLLAQAGWKPDADGVLRNAKGEAFEFEYLSPDEGTTRNVASWMKNLEKLGMRMKVRVVDFALYRKRLEVFDFDMVGIAGGDFTLPSASDFQGSYTSKTADEPGSNNLGGVKIAALDRLIEAMASAHTLDELRTVCRAIDRVVMHSHIMVPELFSAAQPMSYWNKFGIPRVVPQYFTIDSPNDAQVAWPVTTWWAKSAAQR